MVEGAQRVADVVQQRHHHVGFVPPIAVRAGRGLQRMLQAVDRKPAEIAVEQPQVLQHALCQPAGKGHVIAGNDRPVFRCAFDHRGELRAVIAVQLGVGSVHGSSLPFGATLTQFRAQRKAFTPPGNFC